MEGFNDIREDIQIRLRFIVFELDYCLDAE